MKWGMSAEYQQPGGDHTESLSREKEAPIFGGWGASADYE